MMNTGHRGVRAAVLAVLLCTAPVGAPQAASEQQNLEELRNTVINLLQALVDQGVMTRAKAEELVKQAQTKAAESAAQKDKADEGAIRVPYVPQIVKDEISKQVAATVEPTVVDDVVKTAKREGWGVPAALPDWLARVRLFGDVTVRGQADIYARDNTLQVIPDFQSINTAGSVQKAGSNAFLNVSDDRYRMRLRARLGAEASLGDGWSAGIRLSSGSLTDPGSASQTLGTNSSRYSVGIDQAYVRFDGRNAKGFSYFSTTAGRIANPWLAPTELVYARDLTFEGITATGRLGFGDGGRDQSNAFLTVGALPVQEVALSNPDSKWLLGAQLGTNLHMGETQQLRFAIAYYDFLHVSGQQNSPDGLGLLNYTAPAFIRYGNTVFNIANNPSDSTAQLWALAAEFRLVNATVTYEVPVARYRLAVVADAVKNIGDRTADLFNRTHDLTKSVVRNKGYVAEVSLGDAQLDRFGTWRARVGYRYVQDDAVLDSWTDADFHGGGTNARGYYVWGEMGISKQVYARLRYLSANEVDGVPHYGYDIIQLDLLSQF